MIYEKYVIEIDKGDTAIKKIVKYLKSIWEVFELSNTFEKYLRQIQILFIISKMYLSTNPNT